MNGKEFEELKSKKLKLEKDVADLQSEAQTRNNEMNREMRRKERAERELKQLKNDILAKEKQLSEQLMVKKQLTDNISRLENTARDQREHINGLEGEMDGLTERFSRLQQEHENQLSSNQQLEVEVARKSSQLHEKEDLEVQLRSEMTKQGKDIENLKKKVQTVETLKQSLENDKERLKQEFVKKNKDIEELKHQAIVDKKTLSELANARESAELRLERQQQNTKNESAKVMSVENVRQDLQSEVKELKSRTEKLQRFIARVEEERDKYMREGIELTGRIDLLLDEIRNSETLLNNARKQISEKKSELKKKENLYYAVRTDRAHLTQAVTEAQDEIADLKEKMKVLTHQFDQMKEEIVAKEQDLIKEVEDKQKILKEKDNLIKDLEKLRIELISSGKEKQDLGKEMKKIQGSNKKLEMEKMVLKAEMEKQVSHKELLNIKLADKQVEIDTFKRSSSVQQKVLERGEAKYAEKMEDIRILKLEIRRLRDELDLHCKDGLGLQQMKKDVLRLERELMQQKTKNKILQGELENPLNVHRWRMLEGKDPETLELIQKINTLQKRLILKQEEIIEKDLKLEEVEKLYRECKLQLSRQPSYDVHDEIRNLREDIKRKSNQIVLLSTAANVYQTETGNANRNLDQLKAELNMTKLKMVELQKRDIKNKETIGKLKKQKSVEDISTSPGLISKPNTPSIRAKSAGARLVQTPQRRRGSGRQGITGGGFPLCTTIIKLD